MKDSRRESTGEKQAPKAVVNRILQATDKQSVLQRLKAEINAKLHLNPYAKNSR